MHSNAAVGAPAKASIEESGSSDWSQDLDEMLSTLSSNKFTADGENQAQSKVPHFRVKWQADIQSENQNIHHGFINDISTLGASVYLDSSLQPKKPRLYIHVPPLSPTCKPHIIEVSGRALYVVYDGERQLYRTAINFLKFHNASDRDFLYERLVKNHLKIPEVSHSY